MQEVWRKRVDSLRSAYWYAVDTLALNGIVLQQALKGVLPLKAEPSLHFDDRRQGRRLRVEREVTYWDEGMEPRTGHVINVSRGGMYLETSAPLDEGREMAIKMHGNASPRFPSIHGRVVRRAAEGMAIAFI